MVQVAKRTEEERHEDHGVLRSRVYTWDSGWGIVIECGCGEGFVFAGETTGTRAATPTTRGPCSQK
jgi:hypothetical protein